MPAGSKGVSRCGSPRCCLGQRSKCTSESPTDRRLQDYVIPSRHASGSHVSRSHPSIGCPHSGNQGEDQPPSVLPARSPAQLLPPRWCLSPLESKLARSRYLSTIARYILLMLSCY